MNNSMMVAPPEKQQDEQQHAAWRPWAIVAAAAVAWWLIYNALLPLSIWITTGLLGLPLTSALGAALAFFLYDVPKILMLLSGMIFLITTLRTFFQRRTHAPAAGRQAHGDRQRAGGRPGHRHPLLLLLGRAALYRLCQGGRAAGGDLLLPDRGADGQRGGAGHALRHVRLAGGADLHGHRAADRHCRRAGHRPHPQRGARGRGLCVGHACGQQRSPAWREDELGRTLHHWLGGHQGDRGQGVALCDRWVLPSAPLFTAMCPRMRWPGSWARTPGGACRWPWRSGCRCTRMPPG